MFLNCSATLDIATMPKEVIYMKPLVGITLGDPNGIGPEITLKALLDTSVFHICDPLVIGSANVLSRAIDAMGLDLSIKLVKEPREATYTAGCVNVFDPGGVDAEALNIGHLQPEAGKAAMIWIREAAMMAQSGKIDCICTAPINKEAIVKAGFADFRGHTEYLGELAGVEDPLTMFVIDDLRIFFLTRHMSLLEAVKAVTFQRVYDFIEVCSKALDELGIPGGKLAVAALNPHSGEGGLFGREEITEIIPAVEKRRKEGFNVVGPIPADSVFHQAKQGKYDAVVSLYHDQGHIASKTLDFERTVSVTLQLPYLRTSVDHGTALDIAGKWVASTVSMTEALKVAARYSS
jgi:4-hydroxythreonine-4-phosphate dehydrogenase